MVSAVAAFLKIERERKLVEGARCAPHLKEKMLKELAEREAILAAQYGPSEAQAASQKPPK